MGSGGPIPCRPPARTDEDNRLSPGKVHVNTLPAAPSPAPAGLVVSSLPAGFAALTSAAMLALYFTLTQGDGRDHRTAFLAFGLVCWTTNLAWILRSVVLRNRPTHLLTSEAAGPAIGLGLVIAVGWLPESVARTIVVGFSGIGVLALLARFATSVRKTDWRTAIVAFPTAIVLGIGLGGTAWGMGYSSTDIVAGIAREQTHLDTTFHITIARMFETYGRFTTGLDGFVPLSYYGGSHWLFGHLAGPMQGTVIDVYESVRPIAFLPMLLHAILVAAMSLAATDPFRMRRGAAAVWLLAAAMFLGFLPLEVNAANMLSTSLWFQESSNVSMIVVFWTIALTAESWQVRLAPTENRGDTRSPVPFVIFPIAMLLVGLIKFSVMPIFLGLAGFAFLRCGWYRRPIAWISLIVAAAAFVFVKGQVSSAADAVGLNRMILALWRIWSSPAWWPYTIWIQLIWLLLLIGLTCYARGLTTPRHVWRAIRSRTMLHVELAFVVVLLSAGPGAVWDLIAAGAIYFWDWQRWFAMPLVFALWPQRAEPDSRPLLDRPLVKWLGTGLLISLFAMHAMNATLVVRKAIAKSVEIRGLTWEKHSENVWDGWPGVRQTLEMLVRGNSIKRSYGIPRRFAKEEIAAPHRKLVLELQRIGEMPREEKRRTGLFVPKTNRAYWTVSSPSKDPRFPSFLAPTLTGLVCFDHFPPGDEVWNTLSYGFVDYAIPKRTPEEAVPTVIETAAMKKDAVLQKARAAGLSKVIVFDQREDGEFTVVEWPLE
jgi:F0F1-type ATP synthase membrane subunit c/vacuolar-type H+-ATPase subunit K